MCPFKSKKQRAYLWANEPEVAEEFAQHTPKGAKLPMKKQGKKDKMDESLSMRRGKESSKKQSMKDRRDEAKASMKKMKGSY